MISGCVRCGGEPRPSPDVVDLWTIDLDRRRAGAGAGRARPCDDAERARAPGRSLRAARPRALRARPRRAAHGARRLPRGGGGARAARGARAASRSCAGTPGLAFSLSHTGDLAVVAVTARARGRASTSSWLARRTVPPAVMRRVLDEHELALVLAVPGGAARRGLPAPLDGQGGLRQGARHRAVRPDCAPSGMRDALTAPVIGGAGAWSAQRFDPRGGGRRGRRGGGGAMARAARGRGQRAV